MHESLKPYLAHVEAGRIRMVEHDGLVLFNYTDQCTFEKVWDEYTLRARGIIFDIHTGECRARPFDKFFNYTEHEGIYGKEAVAKLHGQHHYLQEKLDGSLGILYWWNDAWRVATRGSFTSDQAIRAEKILARYDLTYFDKRWTGLVEIIYPENKIIVPYGNEEKLVLLAARQCFSGEYATRYLLGFIGHRTGMPVVREETITIEHALAQQKTIPYTNEGWVVVFEDGTRLKIKGDDYMRIAKFKANLSPIAVWEALSLGKFEEMQIACPEECREELKVIAARLTSDFIAIEAKVLVAESFIDWNRPRKDVALDIQKEPKWMHGALFPRLSGSPIRADFLWKLLRPKANEFAELPQ